MKKVYIPTEKELYSLQEFGVDIYYYLLTKTVESMIMSDVIYEEENMFDTAYDGFSSEVILRLASIYPDRISCSKRASNDIELCTKIIKAPIRKNNSIYGLDYLTEFSDEVLQSEDVINSAINMIAKKLKEYPRYRFEYKEPNPVLDSIFNCEIPPHMICDEAFDDIISIDPIWLVKLKDINCLENPSQEARNAIINYASTYGFKPCNLETSKRYTFVDYLNNPNENVKKLIRCLNRHKQYYEL